MLAFAFAYYATISPARGTQTPPPPRIAARIAEAPWRRSFEPASEWEGVRCEVQGAEPLPAALRGALFRNGAGRIRIGAAEYGHWFDGDGYVTRLALDGSRTAVSSGRYVRTPRFLAQGDVVDRMVSRGAWTPRGDGSTLSNAGRMPTNPANTNVVRLPPDNRLYALCEGGRPLELDPVTLATTGREYDAGGALSSPLPGLPPTTFSAHPCVDPTDGCTYNYGLDYGISLGLKLLRIEPNGAVRSRSYELSAMPLYHDISISGKFVLLTATPFRLSKAKVVGSLAGRKGMFAWDSSARPTVEVFDKRTLERVASIPAPPSLSCYHHVNAHENARGQTVLTVDRHNGPREQVEGALARMYDAWFTPELECSLYELVLDVPAAALRSHGLVDGGGAARPAELPSINARFVGRPNRWVYRNALGARCGCLQDLEKVDLRDAGRPVDRWSPGDGRYAGEAVFVPAVAGPVTTPCAEADEDAGWLLSYVYDAAAHASELVVLDARDLAAGPRWTIKLPAHVPPSFHGCFVPAAS